jgi:hypothetical protein
MLAMMWIRTATLVILIVSLCSSAAYACSCAPPRPGSADADPYSGSDVVFEGVAEASRFVGLHSDAEPGKLVPATPGTVQREFTFRVIRNYKNSSAAELKILTGLGMGDCGELFDPDTHYVIHADRSQNGSLLTGICSHNFKVEGTPAKSQAAKLCGSVLVTNNQAQQTVSVSLNKQDKLGLRIVDQVDAEVNGTFCFEDVEPGKYLVAAVAADEDSFSDIAFYPGTADLEDAKAIEVRAGDQITKLIFGFSSPKFPSVSGRVIVDGSKLPDDEVYVFLVGNNMAPLLPALPQRMREDGTFRFSQVRPGHYQLLVAVGSDPDEDDSYRWLTRKVAIDVAYDVSGVELELLPRRNSKEK